MIVDTETNSEAINGHLTDLWCIGMYCPDKDERYLFTDYENKRQEIQDIFNTHNIVMHNASFDLWVLRHYGFDIEDFDDTMIMSYCIRPDGSHSLAGLGELYHVKVKKTEHEDFTQYSDEMGEYCLNDCVATYEIYRSMLPKMSKVMDIYKIEREFIECIIDLNHNGIFMDLANWETVIKEVEEASEQTKSEIMNLIPLVPSKSVKTKNPRSDDTVCTEDNLELGKYVFVEQDDEGYFTYKKVENYNPGSSDQSVWALSKLYGWEPTAYSEKTGKPKLDKEVLGELDYELSALLLKHAKTNKIVTTYGTSLLEKVSDKRLRGNFNQTVTRTGRLSSSNPNLQNLPGRGEIGEKIRHLFICPPDKVLVGCDVDSFQMRILAWYLHHCLGDKMPDANALFDEFNNNPEADPHQAKADLLGIERSIAKNCNFGGVFGFGPQKFAKMSDISLDRAKEIIDLELKHNPSLPKLKEMVWTATRFLKGYCYDLYGRRGYYPDILSSDYALKGQAERRAFNFCIQSTEASIIKLWTIYNSQSIKKQNIRAKLILQVHDEILYECEPEDADKLCSVIQSNLQDSDFLPGLKVTGTPSIGKSWGECH